MHIDQPACPHCGKPITPTPRGRKTGVLEHNSLASRLIAYMRTHPGAAFTYREISERFTDRGMPSGQVGRCLAVALRCGYLTRTITQQGRNVVHLPADRQ